MAPWIRHAEWAETSIDSAGALVHFRKTVSISSVPAQPVYINSELLVIGPVEGDQNMWFYDEVDIQPFLKAGDNDVNVQVLRLYHATSRVFRVFPNLGY